MGLVKIGSYVSEATLHEASTMANAHRLISEYIDNKMKHDNENGIHKDLMINYERSDLLLLLTHMKRQQKEHEEAVKVPRESRKELIRKRRNCKTPPKTQRQLEKREVSNGSQSQKEVSLVQIKRFSTSSYLEMNPVVMGSADGKRGLSIPERRTIEGLNLDTLKKSEETHNDDLRLLQSFMNLQREPERLANPPVLKLRQRGYSESNELHSPLESQRKVGHNEKVSTHKNSDDVYLGRRKTRIMTTIHKRNSIPS